MSNKIHNAADADAVKKAEELKKIRRDQDIDDIKKILSRPEGVRFFRKLLTDGMIFHTTMTGNSWTYFKEGRRDFALQIFNDVCEARPEKVPELLVSSNGEGEN